MTKFESTQKITPLLGVILIFSLIMTELIIIGTSHEAIGDYFQGSGPNFNDGRTAFWVAIGIGFFELALFWLFTRNPLKVRISPAGISYFCFPYLRKEKTIKWHQVEYITFTKVSPIGDFGGWGYRVNLAKKRRGYVMADGPALVIKKADKKYELIFTINHPKQAKLALKNLNKWNDEA